MLEYFHVISGTSTFLQSVTSPQKQNSAYNLPSLSTERVCVNSEN